MDSGTNGMIPLDMEGAAWGRRAPGRTGILPKCQWDLKVDSKGI